MKQNNDWEKKLSNENKSENKKGIMTTETEWKTDSSEVDFIFESGMFMNVLVRWAYNIN